MEEDAEDLLVDLLVDSLEDLREDFEVSRPRCRASERVDVFCCDEVVEDPYEVLVDDPVDASVGALLHRHPRLTSSKASPC